MKKTSLLIIFALLLSSVVVFAQEESRQQFEAPDRWYGTYHDVTVEQITTHPIFVMFIHTGMTGDEIAKQLSGAGGGPWVVVKGVESGTEITWTYNLMDANEIKYNFEDKSSVREEKRSVTVDESGWLTSYVDLSNKDDDNAVESYNLLNWYAYSDGYFRYFPASITGPREADRLLVDLGIYTSSFSGQGGTTNGEVEYTIREDGTKYIGGGILFVQGGSSSTQYWPLRFDFPNQRKNIVVEVKTRNNANASGAVTVYDWS